jgi:hypothetical protein
LKRELLHFAPIPALMYVARLGVPLAVGSVQRYVPPTPVTSGSEAGHSTVGYGISLPPVATGDFIVLALPPSPDDPSTVTPLAAACWNA